MADLIDRKILIRRMCAHCRDNCVNDCFDLKIIKSIPSGVVRCGECERYDAKLGTCPEVDNPLINYLTPDDFCSRGKRRTDPYTITQAEAPMTETNPLVAVCIAECEERERERR